MCIRDSALPTYFTLTIETHDYHTFTLSKRTQQNRVNLEKLYELNNLVRNVCCNRPNYHTLKAQVNEIINIPTNMKLVFWGYGIGTASFTTFFGGGISETICGFFIGLILYFFIWLIEILEINNLVCTLLSSMLLTIIAMDLPIPAGIRFLYKCSPILPASLCSWMDTSG